MIFIRTTEPRHAAVVADIWKKLEAKGEIYFDRYSGMYCFGCEAFYTELQAPDGQCPEHHTKLETKSEEGYFFKTSAYQEWITDYIEKHPQFVVPEGARKEIISRLKSEKMHDLSITRPNKGWGIPAPSDSKYVIYTWFDALINYYAALQDKPAARSYWPAQMHVIGRDILWFHAVIWPMMLKSAGIELPQQVYVHGMVLAEDGRKMSKSLNNGVDPFEVLAKYPVDTFRYFMLRAIPAQSDGKFSMKDLAQRHQSELGNDLGNLLMRIVKLTRKRLGDAVPASDAPTTPLDLPALYKEMSDLIDAREHSKALDRLWLAINAMNSFINDSAPWGIKDDDKKFQQLVSRCMHAIGGIALLLLPFLPESAAKALDSLGWEPRLDFKPRAFQLKDPPQLFPRVEA